LFTASNEEEIILSLTGQPLETPILLFQVVEVIPDDGTGRGPKVYCSVFQQKVHIHFSS
jgi:hypothetical protein